VFGLVCGGLDDAAIAGEHGLFHNTLLDHLAHLCRETGVGNRACPMIWARERSFARPGSTSIG
jgi:DNA-binding NarL/FixJ family response regulator